MGLTIQAPKGLRYLVRAKVQGAEALGLLGVVTFNSQENEKVAEMVLFLDPETTKILQFLDPEIVNMDQKISGSRNCRNCVVSGSINCRNTAVSGSRNCENGQKKILDAETVEMV